MFCKIREPFKTRFPCGNCDVNFGATKTRFEVYMLQFKTYPSQVIYGQERQFLMCFLSNHGPQLDRQKRTELTEQDMTWSTG